MNTFIRTLLATGAAIAAVGTATAAASTEPPDSSGEQTMAVRDGVPAENGLIAFVGTSAESEAESGSEIYVVAPDGTGLRALTSTPDVSEMAPAWSPDGTRLALLRNLRYCELTPCGPPSPGGAELVVIEPATGVETFSAEIPIPFNSDALPPVWSPDGRLIVLNVANWGPQMVDLETSTWTDPFHGWFLGWSPDGRWFVLQHPGAGGLGSQPLLLVPAELLGTTDLDDVSNLPGVRELPVRLARVHSGLVPWMPDSSAVAITLGDYSTDVVTIADGQRRTLLLKGSAASWSPDGRQLAYLRTPDDAYCSDEVRVGAADGTEARAVATSLIRPIWSPDGSLLIGQTDDGLFTVRPDGTDMTLLTPDMRPDWGRVGACEAPNGPLRWLPAEPAVPAEWFGPVWQRMPPPVDAAETTPSPATDG